MKNIYYIAIALLSIMVSSCEEVINVDLPTGPPKLVIDASIKWIKGTAGNEQKIKLTTTTNYYSNTVPPVAGASVIVTNTANSSSFTFVENPGTGEYICTTFEPVLNANYRLVVEYNGQTYTATEKMTSVPIIDKIEQKTSQGFGGEFYEIKAFYTDNGATDDFYLFRYKTNFDIFPTYEVSEDEFYQGNQLFAIYISEDINVGDTLDINISGVSQRYFNYMSKLISVAGNGGINPFQTPPATVRGNIINSTDEKDYPLGYFNVSETVFQEYKVQ